MALCKCNGQRPYVICQVHHTTICWKCKRWVDKKCGDRRCGACKTRPLYPNKILLDIAWTHEQYLMEENN